MNYAYDTEVFKTFFCFNATNGTEDFCVKSYYGFVNKKDVARLLVQMNNEAELVGSYNGLGYDLRILAFILSYDRFNVPCELIKSFSDALIGDGDAPFVDIFSGDWLEFRKKHFDVLNGYKLSKSLKHWELYNGWDVHETDVDFNVDRELTEDEIQKIVQYCWFDCHATLKLMNEEDCVKELKVRARLVDEISKCKNTTVPFDYPKAKLAEEWIYAEDSNIPEASSKTADQFIPWDSFNVPEDLKALLKEICVLGGFKNYKLKHGIKDTEKVLWNGISYGEGGAHYAVRGMHNDAHFFDVASLYPSILIWLQMWKTKNANKRYEYAYHTRLKAKHSGDKFTADSLKLVLNAPTGKFRQQFFTKAQDPAIGLAMCIIGQLVITDAAMAATKGDFSKLIEVNTDSFAVNDAECVERAIEYSKHTTERWATINFEHEVDENGVNEHGTKTYFRDVNNYINYMQDGSVQFKGEEGSDLKKKAHEPVVIRSLPKVLETDVVALEESGEWADYVYKYSKSAGVKNFRIGGKDVCKKHIYFLWTTDEVGEQIEFSAERVTLNGLVKERHGVYAFDIKDLEPYFKYVDRNQYLEDLKLLVMTWKPEIVQPFKEAFRSKRQKSKREFIENLKTLDFLKYRSCPDAIEAEKFLISKGWTFTA